MYNFVKRVFDLCSSAIALIITSPFWLIIAIGVKLSSPGPVFYKSMRAGKNHKEFPVYKFRSMHVYKPEDPNSGKKAEGGFVANENRMFKLGSFLRKSKLDELPQLLSVFIGKMSVVGPRPYPKKAVRKFYTGDYECVMTVKPGLAGLDSLYDYAHGELFVKDNDTYARTVLPVRSELAKVYVEKKSVGLDLYCIFRTIKLIFQIIVLEKKDFELTKYEQLAVKNVEARKAKATN